MANIKISELDELSKANKEDLLVIVDTENNETKKIKSMNLSTNIPTQSTAPENPQINDLWIDTIKSVLKIYNGNSWVTIGSSDIIEDTLPIGSISAYGGENIPTNWLKCNGQEISRSDYSELFNAIGTTYGSGDGTTTFNLPDISERVIVGNAGDGEFSLGNTGGEKEHTLTIDEMPTHTHSFNFDQTAGSIISSVKAGVQSSYGMETGSTGGSQPHNNMQPYISLNYIIKAKQSAGLISNVVNSKSDSTTDTYSCDYINKSETYSTEEVKTNKVWIDGKPIYRKVVDVGNLPNTNIKEIKHNLDINIPIRCFGVCFSNDGISKFTLPISNIYLWLNETNIIVSTTTDRSTYTAKIIIEYTKTTD